MPFETRPCPCGLGLTSYWENDARGIPPHVSAISAPRRSFPTIGPRC